MNITKGMTLTVLRPADGFDGTNKGISSRVHRITVLNDQVPQITEPTESAPAYIIAEKYGHKYLRPLENCPRERGGYMAGGNYAVTCDSRWTFGALPIHDRTESHEQSVALSQ